MPEIPNRTHTVVNFIKSTGLNHRQFCEFIDVLRENHLPYHTTVRLVVEKSCRFFVNFAHRSENFLNEKQRLLTELQNREGLWKLEINVDLTRHMGELNLKLHGGNKLLPDLLTTTIKSFRQKIIMYQNYVKHVSHILKQICQIINRTTVSRLILTKF